MSREGVPTRTAIRFPPHTQRPPRDSTFAPGRPRWLVGSSATLGIGSDVKGNILALTSITFNDDTTLLGRALAQNGTVVLGTGNTMTLP